MYGFRQKSEINDFQMNITDDLEWNFEKCLNRFNSMANLYKISNFVKSWDFPFNAFEKASAGTRIHFARWVKTVSALTHLAFWLLLQGLNQGTKHRVLQSFSSILEIY